jgi:hypothetical protein
MYGQAYVSARSKCQSACQTTYLISGSAFKSVQHKLCFVRAFDKSEAIRVCHTAPAYGYLRLLDACKPDGPLFIPELDRWTIRNSIGDKRWSGERFGFSGQLHCSGQGFAPTDGLVSQISVLGAFRQHLDRPKIAASKQKFGSGRRLVIVVKI